MSADHNLRIISTSTIKVASTARINLTPTDLELLFFEYTQAGFLFSKPTPLLETSILARTTSPSLIHHLRASLEQTLNVFPPLAGRLATITSQDGAATSFFIDCSHDEGGAVFIHAINRNLAAADTHVSTARSLFPLSGALNHQGVSRPLLAVQVTELVDGLYIGMSHNQLVLDATSFWHFLDSWAEISRGQGPIAPPPNLDRDEVNLDLAGSRSIYINNEHLVPHAKPAVQTPNSLMDRVFHLSKQGVAKLKARANREMLGISGGKNSSLQAVIAQVWRSVMRCRFALNLCTEETMFEIPMCIRRRLNPPLPPEYFGNATFAGIVTLEARQILENSLGWTAWQINRMLAFFSDSEQIKCFYRNWIKNPYFPESVLLPSNSFVLINSPRFNSYGTDFGWGKPVAIRGGISDFFDGRITILGGSEEGSIDIEVCSFAETLSCLDNDAEFTEFATPKCSLSSLGLSKL